MKKDARRTVQKGKTVSTLAVALVTTLALTGVGWSAEHQSNYEGQKQPVPGYIGETIINLGTDPAY